MKIHYLCIKTYTAGGSRRAYLQVEGDKPGQMVSVNILMGQANFMIRALKLKPETHPEHDTPTITFTYYIHSKPE